LAIIFTYRPDQKEQPLVYIAGGFETDCEQYRDQLLYEVLNAAGLDKSGMEVFRLDCGKPCVKTDSDLYSFSVSHSKGFIAVALALNGEAGIDTEISTRSVQPSLINRIRSNKYPLEEEGIDALTLWTLKEAFLKMTGKGLRHAMNKVHISRLKPHTYTAESKVGEEDIRAELISFVYRSHRITLSFSPRRIVSIR